MVPKLGVETPKGPRDKVQVARRLNKYSMSLKNYVSFFWDFSIFFFFYCFGNALRTVRIIHVKQYKTTIITCNKPKRLGTT